jgi:hypothetical protein
MSMAAFKLEKRMGRFLGKVIERGLLNAGPLIVHYIERTLPPEYDPNDEDTYPAETEKTVTVTALIHEVSARTTLRQFSEIKAGDLIVTFESEPTDEEGNVINFAALEKIRFEWQGKIYVQQAVGKEVAQYWDVNIGGNPITQTLLLRPSN